MDAYTLVTKALYQVRVDLINSNNIKSVAAYTLSQFKAVLPVYQSVPASGRAAGAEESALAQRLAEARERLAFVEHEAPTTLFSEQEKAGRIATIQAEIAELSRQLGIE